MAKTFLRKAVSAFSMLGSKKAEEKSVIEQEWTNANRRSSEVEDTVWEEIPRNPWSNTKTSVVKKHKKEEVGIDY